MNRSSQFRSREQQQEVQRQHEQAKPLEFATPEQMLRHDALHTPVPPSIAHRLHASVSHLPGARPWWRRLLGL